MVHMVDPTAVAPNRLPAAVLTRVVDGMPTVALAKASIGAIGK